MVLNDKPYMANIVCKSSNNEKMSIKMVIKSCLTALRAAPEQLSIPFNKLPFDQKKTVIGRKKRNITPWDVCFIL